MGRGEAIPGIPVFPLSRTTRRSFNNAQRSSLENAPEVAPYVDRERPPATPKSARDIKPNHVEDRERAEAQRGIPALSRGLERGRAIDPDRTGEGCESDSAGGLSVPSERDRDERREKPPFQPLAHARSGDKLA